MKSHNVNISTNGWIMTDEDQTLHNLFSWAWLIFPLWLLKELLTFQHNSKKARMGAFKIEQNAVFYQKDGAPPAFLLK